MRQRQRARHSTQEKQAQLAVRTAHKRAKVLANWQILG